MKLTSNTILITGGASGIGYELTKQLTALGNTILITGRDQAKLDRAKAVFSKIHTFRSDVSDPEAIATLYEKVTKQFPEPNILINNAGIMREINVHDKAGSLEDITREIEINLSGPIRMVKQFLPHLKTKSEAAIMNVSSGLAFVPLPISPVYCATKAGLHSFTESLRVQLKNTKVKVFELAPPATRTELLDDFNPEDLKGVSIMKVEDMVKVAVKGMQTDRFEIRPGQANQLKMMSRVAPGFILKQMSPVTEQTAESYAATFDTNVLGTLLSLKHQLRVMLPQRQGSIVNVSSTFGRAGGAGAAVYVASKHAVEGLTKAAALEVAGSGVRVNVVAPGPIETGMLNRFTGNEEKKAALVSRVPLKRAGLPEEIAQAIVFLSCDKASFITGASIAVDGGKLAG